jgi:hypothetical protein
MAVPAFRGGIDTKTLSFFNACLSPSIDFCHFAPMFPLNAALDRNAIPEGLPLVSVSQSPRASQKHAVSGLNATAFLPSIPNGGVD